MLGIAATEECLNKYEEFKLAKKIAYLTFIISKSEIKVDKESAKSDHENEEAWVKAFINEVKSTGDARFGVVDSNGKICMVSWVPDTAKAQNKMKYASAKEPFIQSLQGLSTKLQATDDSEFNYEAVVESTKSKV
mmetsp:Transcript_39312/g.62802  ORF Transcript_39312/g.62802 Transcript_39312/m.62802 type:complete len:135 (+) Transcript_39312:115-519(+)